MTLSKTVLIALALASAAPSASAADEPAWSETGPAIESNAVDGTGTFSVNPGIGDAPAVFVNPQDLRAEGDERAAARAAKSDAASEDAASRNLSTREPSTT